MGIIWGLCGNSESYGNPVGMGMEMECSFHNNPRIQSYAVLYSNWNPDKT